MNISGSTVEELFFGEVKRIREFFNGFHVELFEIEAEEVLRHDKSIIPKYLTCRQVI